MQYVEGVRDYRRLREGAIEPEIELLDEPVMFAGLDDLIAMKTAAGRDQDLIDIDARSTGRAARRRVGSERGRSGAGVSPTPDAMSRRAA